MPFGGQSMRQLVHNIVHTTPSIVNPNYSAEIKDACMRMLRKNHKDRPSINSCLALPLLKSRLSGYLDNYKIHHEFLHTILHGQHILMNKVESKNNPVSNSPSNNRVVISADIVPVALLPPPPVPPKKIINNINNINRPPLPPAPIPSEAEAIPNKFQKMVDEIRQRELQRDKDFNEQRLVIEQHKRQQQQRAENNIKKIVAARNQVSNPKKPAKAINENQMIAKAKAKVLELQAIAAKEEKDSLVIRKASPKQYEKPWLVPSKKQLNSPQVKNHQVKNLQVKKALTPSPAAAVVKPSPVIKKSPSPAEKKIISPRGKGGQVPSNRGQNDAMINKKKPINGWLSELELQMGNLKGQINDIKIAASPKLILRGGDSPSNQQLDDNSLSLDSYEQEKIAVKNIVKTPASVQKNKKDIANSNSPASGLKKKVVSPSTPSGNKVKITPAHACNESVIDEHIKKEFLLLRKEIREQRSAGFREFIKNQRKDHPKLSPATMAAAVDNEIIVEDIIDDHNAGVLVIDVEEFSESVKSSIPASVKVVEPKRLQTKEIVKKTRLTPDELKAQREADRIALRELIKSKKKERNLNLNSSDNVQIQVVYPHESPQISHNPIDNEAITPREDVIHNDYNVFVDICKDSDVDSSIIGDIPVLIPPITFPTQDEQSNLTDAITPPTPFTSEECVILLDQMNIIVNTSNGIVENEKNESEFDDGSDTDDNIVLDDAVLDIQLDEIMQQLNSHKINMSDSFEYNDMTFDSCYSSANTFDLSVESDASDEIEEDNNIQENIHEKEDMQVESMTSVDLRELLCSMKAIDNDTEVIPNDYTSLYSYLNDRLGGDVLSKALTFLKSIATDSNSDDIDDVYLEQLEDIVGSSNIGCISLIYSLTLL